MCVYVCVFVCVNVCVSVWWAGTKCFMRIYLALQPSNTGLWRQDSYKGGLETIVIRKFQMSCSK